MAVREEKITEQLIREDSEHETTEAWIEIHSVL